MASTEAKQVPTIAELVQRRLDGGLSLTDLERLADSGVARQQFDLISKGRVAAFPGTAAIEATAKALGVDARTVVLAYAQQLGLRIDEDRSPLATMLPANTADLTIPQAQAIAGLIRAFATPAAHAIECETLNLRVFDDNEIRQVGELWTEMTDRAKTAPPAMAHALTCLAEILEVALEQIDQEK